jgi:predicted oxidoreductase
MADVIVVGSGLAGLVAATEIADAGRSVLLLDQEPECSLGGQAWWSFGGLFLVDSPEQRRLRVRDSRDLAWQDWLGSAGFDREDEDHWPRQWAEAYVDFAAGEKRAWLHDMGMRWFPLVQWAERGGYVATGHGNSVPRFHITWGTGPGVVAPFLRRAREAERAGLLRVLFRRRVTGLSRSAGAIDGVEGEILADDHSERAVRSTRQRIGTFEMKAAAVVMTTGGIGGNHDLVRRIWPSRHATPPKDLLAGVPDYVDGSGLEAVEAAGGRVVNADRMWNYPEGIHNPFPVWTRHGIRVLSGPSPLWLDARGRRLPAPLFPGFDSLGALEHILRSGYAHSWFLLNRRILGKELALSGSEQNPDLTDRDLRAVLKRALPGAISPVESMAQHCPDFVSAATLPELVSEMNAVTGAKLIDARVLEEEVVARDREVECGLGKDAQVIAAAAARRFLGDRLIRVVPPHRLLDPAAGPLVAIRLSILTRKTLGGLETDLQGRVLQAGGHSVPGVYAAGEVAGFGGGGMHGYRALEGTFLGGCIFSGRVAGRAAAAAV